MAEPLLATGQRGRRGRSGRLESIDVLRGVAVLSVGVTHLIVRLGAGTVVVVAVRGAAALVSGFALHHLVEKRFLDASRPGGDSGPAVTASRWEPGDAAAPTVQHGEGPRPAAERARA